MKAALLLVLAVLLAGCGGGSDDELECSKDDPTCKCVEAGKSFDCK